MQKLWLLISVNDLNFKEKPIAVERARGPIERPRIRDEPVPKEFQNMNRISCQKFTSLAELEEVANESLKKDSTNQYMIFEAISVMEIIPTNPICKKFNENGELLI